RRGVLEDATLTDGRDPRPERQQLLALEGPSEEDGVTGVERLDRDLAQQPGLADSGLAEHDRDLSCSVRGAPREGLELCELGLPPDERDPLVRQAQPPHAERRSRRSLARRRSRHRLAGRAGSLLEKLLIELLGLGLGLRAQLSLQEIDTHLVLAERGG